MQTLSAPSAIDYQLQLKELRQQEDHLFQLALANPKESQLVQFEAIWNTRNEIHKKMENTMTPMLVEPLQASEQQESNTYTVQELKAIPVMDTRCPELTGKLFYSSDNRPQLRKRFKLPAIVIERYKLTLRQVAILEGKLRIASQLQEDAPDRHDNYSESVRDETGYAYTARDIIAGRY